MIAPVRPKSESEFFLKLWDRQKLTAPIAKGVLKLGFADEELARVSELRAKNAAGKITAEELEEFDAFLRASFTLSILQSKARQFLKATAKVKPAHA